MQTAAMAKRNLGSYRWHISAVWAGQEGGGARNPGGLMGERVNWEQKRAAAVQWRSARYDGNSHGWCMLAVDLLRDQESPIHLIWNTR
ncbi:hypothetical protein G9P44_001099 [Scheffersomyces stipitis]|nr:hypothetical protein G9P44_001099 [Scheffersomyces stipitis]